MNLNTTQCVVISKRNNQHILTGFELMLFSKYSELLK